MDAPRDDLLLGDPKEARGRLFLEHYAEAELASALRERGFWDALARRGHPDARLRIERDGSGAPRVVVRDGEEELGEVRAHHRAWRGLRAIQIDWLEMRDPRRAFSPERPPLPGQRAPGLGVGRRVVELLVAAARRTGADVLVATPQHYHNAVLYGRLGFRYADPALAGRLLALERDLARLPLAAASWAVEEGRVREARSGARVEWSAFAQDQALPVTAAASRELRGWGRALRAWRAQQAAAYVVAGETA